MLVSTAARSGQPGSSITRVIRRPFGQCPRSPRKTRRNSAMVNSYGIGLIDNDGQVPLGRGLLGSGELGEPERAGEQRAREQGRTEEEQNMCPAQHLNPILKT